MTVDELAAQVAGDPVVEFLNMGDLYPDQDIVALVLCRCSDGFTPLQPPPQPAA